MALDNLCPCLDHESLAAYAVDTVLTYRHRIHGAPLIVIDQFHCATGQSMKRDINLRNSGRFRTCAQRLNYRVEYVGSLNIITLTFEGQREWVSLDAH